MSSVLMIAARFVAVQHWVHRVLGPARSLYMRPCAASITKHNL